MFGHLDRILGSQSVLSPVIPTLKSHFLKKRIQMLKELSKCLRNFRSMNSGWTQHYSVRHQRLEDCGCTGPAALPTAVWGCFWFQWKPGDAAAPHHGDPPPETCNAGHWPFPSRHFKSYSNWQSVYSGLRFTWNLLMFHAVWISSSLILILNSFSQNFRCQCPSTSLQGASNLSQYF